ncbi:unnamed protein product, partial [Heterosigma akashiwo]
QCTALVVLPEGFRRGGARTAAICYTPRGRHRPFTAIEQGGGDCAGRGGCLLLGRGICTGSCNWRRFQRYNGFCQSPFVPSPPEVRHMECHATGKTPFVCNSGWMWSSRRRWGTVAGLKWLDKPFAMTTEGEGVRGGNGKINTHTRIGSP